MPKIKLYIVPTSEEEGIGFSVLTDALIYAIDNNIPFEKIIRQEVEYEGIIGSCDSGDNQRADERPKLQESFNDSEGEEDL